MSKVKKNQFNSEATVDVLVPIGCVIQVDEDLELRDGENPTKRRLAGTSDECFIRWEERVLKALRAEFGSRVVNFATAPAYVGDPNTGMQRPVHGSGIVPDLPGSSPEPATQPAPEAEPEPETDEAPDPHKEFGKLKVSELRNFAVEMGVESSGRKKVIIDRLVENLDDPIANYLGWVEESEKQ